MEIYSDINSFNTLSTRDKKAEFANSIDVDKTAQNEPPHQDLHFLSSVYIVFEFTI